MSWLAVWSFLKKYWKEVLIAVLVIAFASKTRMDYKELENRHAAAKAIYEARIDSLTTIHEEELRKREEALQQYQTRLEEIERNYSEQKEINEELLNRKEETLKKKFTLNKNELADEITIVFGFEYVP